MLSPDQGPSSGTVFCLPIGTAEGLFVLSQTNPSLSKLFAWVAVVASAPQKSRAEFPTMSTTFKYSTDLFSNKCNKYEAISGFFLP
jgi:hypothetical protein